MFWDLEKWGYVFSISLILFLLRECNYFKLSLSYNIIVATLMWTKISINLILSTNYVESRINQTGKVPRAYEEKWGLRRLKIRKNRAY